MYLCLMVISSIMIAVLLTPSYSLESECEIHSFSVVCYEVKGKFLPPNVSTNVSSLFIVSSNMNSLSAKDFLAFENISSLTIDNCAIQIDKNIPLLSKLVNLNSLTIQKSNVNEEVFSLLGNHLRLCQLSLSGNKLSVIKKSYFENLLHLCKIDISHNEISEIENDAFNDIPPVLKLDMSHNGIGKDFDSSFLSLPTLCTFCPLSTNTKRCPRDSLKRCQSNAALDALWGKFGTAIIPDLSDNPLCAKLNHSIRANRDEPDGVAVASNSVDEEKPWNVIGKCPDHEERKKFLQRACNQDAENDDDEILMVVQVRDPLLCEHSEHHTEEEEKDRLKLIKENQGLSHRTSSDSNLPSASFQSEWQMILAGVLGSVVFVLCFWAAFKWKSDRKKRYSKVKDDRETKKMISNTSLASVDLQPQALLPPLVLSSSLPPSLKPPPPSPSGQLRPRAFQSEAQKKN